MRYSSILLGLLGLLFATPVKAQNASLFGNPGHWYVGAQGGLSMISDYDMGFAAGGFFGFDLDGPIRAEVAVGAHKASYEQVGDMMGATMTTTADLFAISTLAYGIYDFEIGGQLTPYAGAGLGVVRETVDVEIAIDDPTLGAMGSSTSGSSMGFAFSGVAGVDYALSPSISVRAQGRYINSLGSIVEVGFRIPLSRK